MIMAVLLVTGVVSTSVGWVRASHAESRAVHEATRANEVKRIIREMLSSVDPNQAQSMDVALLTIILDGTAQRLETGEITDVLIAAELHEIIGSTYRSLGRYDKAQNHLPIAVEVLSRELGEDHPETLVSMDSLAGLLADQGLYVEAELLFQKTIDLRERVLGEEDVNTLQSIGNLAVVYRRQGRYVEAESLFRELVEIHTRVLGEENLETVKSIGNVATVCADQGQYAEAERLIRKTLNLFTRLLGEENPATLNAMHGHRFSSFYPLTTDAA